MLQHKVRSKMCGLILLSLMFVFVPTEVLGFKLDPGPSLNHQEITEMAMLNVTAQACRAVAQAEGWDFTFPASLTADSVLAACAAGEAAKTFEMNKDNIKQKNVLVDLLYVLSPSRHFDDESFNEGKTHITDGLQAVKDSINKENFDAARTKLGEILHTLQDFYSHSNWIEMGNDRPNSNLIRKDVSIGNIADKTRPTCRNCTGEVCTNNILEDILNEKVLTSGYFALWPKNGKEKGKCSHGDSPDNTRHTEATGGINKDSLTSSHGHLHTRAANVAIAATSELLEDVRAAAGDKNFLRMMGVTAGKALCFVIDTTGSMGDDIEAVQFVTATIINEMKNKHSVYILVPYNDPGFGPLVKTTDVNTFKNAINALVAGGGGDEPEMALSGLQLALTGAPFGSEIFLFTDASAKDAHLKNTIIALIERTRSVVNVIITTTASRRRRSSRATRLTPTQIQVYKDLALASGGQAIEAPKSQLLEAITVFLESFSSTLVTLLQAVRNPGRSETFTFAVDQTVKNLNIYITGTSNDFTLVSPSGEVQESVTGSLITSTVTVGNLQAFKLKTEVGQWEMRMRSTVPYTLKIVAQSPIDIFYSFMKPSQVRSDGYAIDTGRPSAGQNGTLMVMLIGSDTNVTQVHLVDSMGSGQVQGTVIPQDTNEYLVQFDRIPSQEFTVLVKGQKGNSSSRSTPVTFQRQSTTNTKASSVSVTADQSNSIIKPGATLSVNFTVSTSASGGTFTVRATNDQGLSTTFPSTLEVVSGGSADGTVQLPAPSNTESGTEITLTIEAESPGGTDMNYVVLTITVLEEVTDFNPPVYERRSPEQNCSEPCTSSTWQLSVGVSDGANGTGLDRVFLRQGNSKLNTTRISEQETVVSYEASCCSPTVELVAVDRAGNVGSFSYTVQRMNSTTITTQPTSTTTTPTSTTTTQPTSTTTTPTSTTTTQPTSTTTTQPTSTTTTTQPTSTTTTQPTSTTTTQPTSTTTTTQPTSTTTQPTSTTTPPTSTTTATPPTWTCTSLSLRLVQSPLLCLIVVLLGFQVCP